MSHRIRPTAREAKVRHYSPAGNANLIKNPSPVASEDAGFGESGSGRSGNRYAARLGITSGNVDLKCRIEDSSFMRNPEGISHIQNGLRELEESGARSGNGKWNQKAIAGGEIPAAGAAGDSGKVQKSATRSLAAGFGDAGFSAEVSGASGSQGAIKQQLDESDVSFGNEELTIWEIEELANLRFVNCSPPKVAPHFSEITTEGRNYRRFESFSLLRISDVYEEYKDGKELIFLDANLDAIKIEKIEKVPHSGKIYDVDVPNDIVLVRRSPSNTNSIKPSKPVWSGNSNDPSMVLGLDFSEIEYPSHYPDDADLVGYWDFDGDDQTTNLTLDSSDYNNTGECSGSGGNVCNWTAGKVGAGMLFDGANDKITISDNPPVRDIFGGGGTIEAWIYPKSDGESNEGAVASTGPWQSKGWNFQVMNEASDKVSINLFVIFDGDDGHWESPVTIPINTWAHVAATYNDDATGNDAAIYINGISQTVTESSTPTGSYTSDSGEDFIIGNNPPTTRTFDGLIDEIAIYSRALNQSEIMRNYEKGFKRIKDESAVYCDNCSRMHNNFAVFPSDLANVSAREPAADPDLTAEGKHGSALVFDGVDDYLDCGNDSSLRPNEIGLELWFKSSATPNNDILAGVRNSAYDGYHLFLDTAAKIRWLVAEDASSWKLELIGDNAIAAGTWYHVVGTYESGDGRFFVDGVQQSQTSSATGNPYYIPASFILGMSYAQERYFNGTLDSVAIYNRTLSAWEIRQHATDRYTNASGLFAGDQNRYFQYRVFMSTIDTNVTPKLNELSFTQTDFDITVLNALPSDGDVNLTGPANGTWFTSQPNFNWTAKADIDYNYLNMSDSGLVSYWTFDARDKNDSHVYDVKGSNHGWIIGGALCGNVTGRAGAACSFDGSGDYVNGSDSTFPNGTSARTVEMWINPKEFKNYQALLFYGTASLGSGFLFSTGGATEGTTNLMLGIYSENSGSSTGNLTLNVWQHIAITVNTSGNVSVYINGEGEEVRGVSGMNTVLGGTYKIGDGWNVNDDFNGTIDEVAIYNRTLSAAEIADHYRSEDMRYELLIANNTDFTSAGVAFGGLVINNFSQPLYRDDEYTVLVEHFDSLEAITWNNGTVYGNFSICEGRFGTGGCFDGANAYIDYGNGSTYNLTGDITVEAWVKPNDISDTWGRVVDKANCYILHVTSGEVLQCNIYADSNGDVGTASLTQNEWAHVACTYDGQNVRVYRDGALQDTTARTGSIAGTSDNVYVGGNSGLSRRWNGTIDEVRISNVARIPVSALPNSSTYSLGGAYNISDSVNSSLYYWKVRPLNIDDRSEDDEQIYGDWSGTRTFYLDATDPVLYWTRPRSDNLSILGGWFFQNITTVDTNLFWMNCTIYNSTGHEEGRGF